jgi:mRNA-degrading endonuclease YafQ of YafQ-DinJ toxin-antitoxin module
MPLNLVERSSEWRVDRSEIFDESLNRMTVVFADLPDKLGKFLTTKIVNPIVHRYGKHDRRLTGDLAGFYHCHLRDDAVLIYSLANRVMTLIYVAPHAEIEGKRLKLTARRLAPFAA